METERHILLGETVLILLQIIFDIFVCNSFHSFLLLNIKKMIHEVFVDHYSALTMILRHSVLH